MIESTPAAMAAWKGGASMRSHSSRVWVITGSSVWLSCPVSPWPGKCFAQATTAARR